MMTSTPHSRTLVVSADNEVLILRPFVQVNDLTAQRELTGCVMRFLCSVAFDPNGQLLPAVGWDFIVRL